LVSLKPKQLPLQDGEVFAIEAAKSEESPTGRLLITRRLPGTEHSWDEPSNAEVASVQEEHLVRVPAENRVLVESISERRDSHRYGLRVPLVFCPMHSPISNGHLAKSINISSRGVYFVTSHPVFVGLPLQVRLRMPARIAGTIPIDRIFDGRVAHIEWKNVPSGCCGVGVEFFYWEIPRKTCQ
jgi:hypothetical protein